MAGKSCSPCQECRQFRCHGASGMHSPCHCSASLALTCCRARAGAGYHQASLTAAGYAWRHRRAAEQGGWKEGLGRPADAGTHCAATCSTADTSSPTPVGLPAALLDCWVIPCAVRVLAQDADACLQLAGADVVAHSAQLQHQLAVMRAVAALMPSAPG